LVRAVRVRAVESQESGLIHAAQMLAANQCGFRADVNEATDAGLLGGGEHTLGALHVYSVLVLLGHKKNILV